MSRATYLWSCVLALGIVIPLSLLFEYMNPPLWLYPIMYILVFFISVQSAKTVKRIRNES